MGKKTTKSPLVEACLVQNVKLVDLLLEHGANPNLASTSSNMLRYSQHKYPLFVAVYDCNSDIVISLLNAGADINAVNGVGDGIVSVATENLIFSAYEHSTEQMRIKLSTVRLLLQHGANVNMIALAQRSFKVIASGSSSDGYRGRAKMETPICIMCNRVAAITGKLWG